MSWEDIIKVKAKKNRFGYHVESEDIEESHRALAEEIDNNEINKESSPLLEKLDPKKKKRLKKILQSTQPSEYMGQDFTKLGKLIDELKDAGLMKTKKMHKKMKAMDEKNVSMVATASELRKDYEILYRQLRGMVYPKSRGDLGEEKDE
jgi:hypothetical protein